eukprot:6477390-Amphidinium_carterae.1
MLGSSLCGHCLVASTQSLATNPFQNIVPLALVWSTEFVYSAYSPYLPIYHVGISTLCPSTLVLDLPKQPSLGSLPTLAHTSSPVSY